MAITQDSHKQGLIWQSSTGQMRYSDKNQNDQWIQQIPYYPIAEDIKYGNLVTIREDGKLHLTDSRIDEICVGIALEPGKFKSSQLTYIHVQPFGKFTYRREDKQTGNDNISETLYNATNDYDPLFKVEDIGKYAYAKYSKPGEIFVGNDETLQQNQSLIRVGTVVSLTELDILIYNSKDRGNVDRADVYMELGEDVTIFEGFPKVFAIGNDSDQYLSFSFVRRKDKYSATLPKTSDFYIFMCNKDGKGFKLGYTTPNKLTQKDEDLNFMVHSCKAIEYYNTSALFSGNNSFISYAKTKVGVELNQTLQESDGVTTSYTFTAKKPSGPYYIFLSDEMKEYFDLQVNSYGSSENKGKAILADIRIPSRRNVFGFYDLTNADWQTAAKTEGRFIKLNKGVKYPFLRSGTISIETFDEYFKWRDYFNKDPAELSQIESKTSEAGDNVGSPLYLGTMGNLIKTPHVKYGYIDPVATYLGIPNNEEGKDQEHKLLVDCKAPSIFFNDSIPVAYLRKCPVYEAGAKKIYLPDYGHLVASGKNAIYTKEKENEAEVQKYLIATYSSLYNKLQETYYVETDGDYFYIPEVTDSHGNFMEFNYVDRGIFSSPRIEQPYLRRYGTFTLDTTKAEISADTATLKKNGNNFNFDITELVNYGVFENSKAAPQLDSFDIHLYIDLNNERFNALGYFGADKPSHWVEVYPGYYNYNNNQAYGYTWRIITSEGTDYIDPNEKDGYNNTRYYLTTFIGDNDAEKGKGICYVASTNEAPYTLEGVDFKVTIARKDNLPRQFDLQCFIDEFEGRLSVFAGDALSDAVKAHIEKDIKAKLFSETNEMAGSVLEAKITEFGLEDKVDSIITSKNIPAIIDSIILKYSDNSTNEYKTIKDSISNALKEVENSYKADLNSEYNSVKNALQQESQKTLEAYIQSRGITNDYLQEIVNTAVQNAQINLKINQEFEKLDWNSPAISAISNNLAPIYEKAMSSSSSDIYSKTLEETKKIIKNSASALIIEALAVVDVNEDISNGSKFKNSIKSYINLFISDEVSNAITNENIPDRIDFILNGDINNEGEISKAIKAANIQNQVQFEINNLTQSEVLKTWQDYWGTSTSKGRLQNEVINVVDTRFNSEFDTARKELTNEFSSDKSYLENLNKTISNSLSSQAQTAQDSFETLSSQAINDLNALTFSTSKRTSANDIVNRRNLKVAPEEFLGGVPAIETHREAALSEISTLHQTSLNSLLNLSGFSNSETQNYNLKTLLNNLYSKLETNLLNLSGFSSSETVSSNLKSLLETEFINHKASLLNLVGKTPEEDESLIETLTKTFNNYISSFNTKEQNIKIIYEKTEKALSDTTLNIGKLDSTLESLNNLASEIETLSTKINNDINTKFTQPINDFLTNVYDNDFKFLKENFSSYVNTINNFQNNTLPGLNDLNIKLFSTLNSNNKLLSETIIDVDGWISLNYDNLISEINDLNSQMSITSSSINEVNKNIEDFNTDKEEVEEKIEDIERTIATANTNIEDFNTTIEDKIKEFRDASAEFNNYVKKTSFDESIKQINDDLLTQSGKVKANADSITNLVDSTTKQLGLIQSNNDRLTTLEGYFEENSFTKINLDQDSILFDFSETQSANGSSANIVFDDKVFIIDFSDSKVEFKNFDKIISDESYIDAKENYVDLYANKFISTSLSKYKRIYGERDLDKFSNWTELTPGSIKYTNNNEYTNDYNGLLGSALQAAYEMPLAYWQYNSDHEADKKTLGIIVERLKDITKDNSILHYDGEVDSLNKKVTPSIRNIFKVYSGEKPNERDSETILISENSSNKYISEKQNKFVYTKKEVESIKEYIRTITNTDENGENIVASVGFLFAAAKETQERLLQLEASTFGFDAKTIPGDKTERYKNVIENSSIIPVDVLCNDPTSLGLNRLIRALCDEVYHTSNPMNAADFTIKDNPDSTVSRIDMLDESFHGKINYANGKARSPSNYSLADIDSHTYPYKISKSEIGNWDQDVKTLEAKFTDSKNDTIVDKETSGVKTNQFNGVNDAIDRITKKLNQLTVDVHGADNIDINNDTTLLCNFEFSYEDYIN